MQKVLTAAQMREVDRLTTERYGFPSIILMENAAHAVARVMTEKLGGRLKEKTILILCGRGNNGGDGAALARILALHGAAVDLVLLGKIEDSEGDARTNFEIVSSIVALQPSREFQLVGNWFATTSGGTISLNFCHNLESWQGEELGELFTRADVIVDAIVGTGLNRPLTGVYQEVARSIAWKIDDRVNCKPLIISLDIPSGLGADSSAILGVNAVADATIAFTAPKAGNVLPGVAGFGGELFVADIGSPFELLEEVESHLFVAEKNDLVAWFWESRFLDDSYKNKRGHAFLIAGSEDYSGAAVLAGNSAMRSGVGLVTLAAPKECKPEIASRLLPDVILKGIDHGSDQTEKADAIAIGCGLSATDPAIEKLVRNLVATREVPMIIDAGALWFYSPMSKQDVRSPTMREGASPLIFTPHEGEFLRLLGTENKDVIRDRVGAVRDFATTHNVILVLKGERVLIGEPGGKVVVNPTGNSGLGKAGNGDTLTGILAGFLAQANAMNIDLFETVVAAVYVAGMAGDIAEEKFGKRVMTASDVRECLADVFSRFEPKRQPE